MNLDILKDKKILFVEDDELIINSIEPVLKKVFQNIFMAKNGKDGLDLFKKNKDIDFIITDIKMSKMNGLKMIEEIQKIKQNIPTILITADGEYESFLKADELGVYRYILKPLDVQEILEAIIKHIENN